MAIGVGQRCVVRIQITDIELRNAKDIVATVESPQYVAHCQEVSFDEVSGLVYVAVDVNSAGSYSMWLEVRFAEEIVYTPAFVFAEVEGEATPCDAPYIVDVEVAGESVSVTPPKIDVDAVTREEFERLSKDVAGKVDKVEGKGLSTNDFTDEYKKKVDEFSGGGSITIDKVLSATSDNAVANSAVTKALNSKQDTLTLTTKPNGNIVIGNLAGQTKEFMPATPSGDPMHYAYEAVGATYNNTSADITSIGIYGDTIVHKAGCWLLSEVGDLSNSDMNIILANPTNWNDTDINLIAAWSPARTTIPKKDWTNLVGWYGSNINPKMWYAFYMSSLETIRFSTGDDSSYKIRPANMSGMFRGCTNLTKILNIINCINTADVLNGFYDCKSLSEIRIKNLKVSSDFHWSPLSVASAIYLLQNADATAQFTVTFRADRQAIYEANTDFMTAKSAKPNITILYQ